MMLSPPDHHRVTALLPRWRTTLRWLLPAAALLVFSGCRGPARQNDYHAFVYEPRPVAAAAAYRLAPPDEILVTSRQMEHLTGYQVIRPDGRITLPGAGTFDVAGRTPEEITILLRQTVQGELAEPDLTVHVSRYASQKFFVFGEVARAGAYPFTGNNSLMQTLATAMPSRLADVSRIQVIRPSPDGDFRQMLTVNFDHMVRYGDTTLNAVLQEGDVIFVPPTGVASFGLAVRQFLMPLMPWDTHGAQPVGHVPETY